jgi:ribonuclease HII
VIIVPSSRMRSIVKDSKLLTENKREEIFGILTSSNEVFIGISIVDAASIDEMNILQATLKAMEEAVKKLTIEPRYALVDGNALPKLPCQGIPVIAGDECEPSISAASIIAKVTRDRLMVRMDERYPGYGFARHKGYPTKAHVTAIRTLGVCPIHRRTFKGVC